VAREEGITCGSVGEVSEKAKRGERGGWSSGCLKEIIEKGECLLTRTPLRDLWAKRNLQKFTPERVTSGAFCERISSGGRERFRKTDKWEGRGVAEFLIAGKGREGTFLMARKRLEAKSPRLKAE